MSDSSFSFPHRTPVFTALIVILCFAAFGWLAKRIYVPHAADVQPVEGVLTPAERATRLAEIHAKEQAAVTSYGWVDQPKGIVRLPLDRAMELTVRDHAKQ